MSLKIQVARKEHICCLCERRIPVGDRYWRHFERNDAGGIVKDEKTHINCELYRQALTAAESR